MAAPKGNQYAKGNNGGRPFTYDRHKMAIDLIEWAKQDDSLNLCKFCCSYDPPIDPHYLIKTAKEDDELGNAYRTAKSFLGARREEMLNINKLNARAYEANKHVYDMFIKDDYRDNQKFESDLKKQVADDVSAEYKTLLASVMNQLKSIQPERKQSNISSSADTKSD